EVFAGYERFFAANLVGRYGAVPSPVRRAINSTAALLPRQGAPAKARRFLDRAGMGLPDALRAWISYVPEEVVADLVPGGDDWAIEDYRSIWRSSEGAPTLSRILHQNLMTYLLDD